MRSTEKMISRISADSLEEENVAADCVNNAIEQDNANATFNFKDEQKPEDFVVDTEVEKKLTIQSFETPASTVKSSVINPDSVKFTATNHKFFTAKRNDITISLGDSTDLTNQKV